MYKTHGVYRETQKISDTLRLMEGYLKRILPCLHWNKYNEINLCHSDAQKHVSYFKKMVQML